MKRNNAIVKSSVASRSGSASRTAVASESGSGSGTASASESATETSSVSDSVTGTISATGTATAKPSESATPTPPASNSATKTTSARRSATGTSTVSEIGTRTPIATQPASNSPSFSSTYIPQSPYSSLSPSTPALPSSGGVGIDTIIGSAIGGTALLVAVGMLWLYRQTLGRAVKKLRGGNHVLPAAGSGADSDGAVVNHVGTVPERSSHRAVTPVNNQKNPSVPNADTQPTGAGILKSKSGQTISVI